MASAQIGRMELGKGVCVGAGGGRVLAWSAWQSLNGATSRWWKWSGTGKPRQVQGGRGWVLCFVFRCLQNPGVGCQLQGPRALAQSTCL